MTHIKMLTLKQFQLLFATLIAVEKWFYFKKELYINLCNHGNIDYLQF